MANYTGRLGGNVSIGFPARTLAFVRVPPAVPTIPSFDPVTDVSASLLKPRNQTYTYPAAVAPTFVSPLPPVTTWGQQEPNPVQDFKRQQFTYPEAVAPLVPIVPTLVLGWRIPREAQVSQRPLVYAYPSSLTAPLVPIVPALVLGWRTVREIQVAQRPLVYTYPSWSMNPAPVVAGEVITVDKWWKQHELPSQGPQRRPDLSSSFAFTLLAVGETITVDKWYTAPGGPRQDATRRQDLFSPGGFTARVVAAETITVDKWFHQTSRTLSGARANQYSYASTASFVELVAAAETITMDKWYNRTSTPVRDAARTQYTFPASVMDTKPPAAVVVGVIYEERIELGSFFGITVPDIDLGIA